MKLYSRSTEKGSPLYVRFMIRGKRVQWCTGTNDKATAKARAKEYRSRLEQEGFAATTGFRRREEPAISIAEALRRYAELDLVRAKSLQCNLSSVRVFCRDAGIEIDAPLTALTADAVWAFEKRRLQTGDAARNGTVRRSIHSTLRQARSVFSAQTLGRKVFGDISRQQLEGFLTAPIGKAPKSRYTVPPQALIDRTFSALPALRESDPAAAVAFVLAACCGLRKGEIGAARWDWIDFDRATLHIRIEDDFVPKSGEERLVGIPAEALQALGEARQPGRYILPGCPTERKEKVFRRLNAWLRGLGWDREKGIHELRKYYGAQIASQAGLYVAQRALGHSTPTVTNDHYADLVNTPTLNIRTA